MYGMQCWLWLSLAERYRHSSSIHQLLAIPIVLAASSCSFACPAAWQIGDVPGNISQKRRHTTPEMVCRTTIIHLKGFGEYRRNQGQVTFLVQTLLFRYFSRLYSAEHLASDVLPEIGDVVGQGGFESALKLRKESSDWFVVSESWAWRV